MMILTALACDKGEEQAKERDRHPLTPLSLVFIKWSLLIIPDHVSQAVGRMPM